LRRQIRGAMSTAELLARARLLDRDLAPGEPLADTVIRPLAAAVTEAEPEVTEDGTPAERLWELAKDATRLRARAGAHEGLIEATAALQHLACLFAEDAGDLTERIAELADIQGELEPRVDVAADGPYLVTNVSRITNWLGEPVVTFPQMALCRCGQSATKPLCDGSHARTGFSGVKDPARVPDRLDSYEGVQVTVLDNRGVCAH
ncbi:CDGSH iron-sulfur domain-containing protein, partial [Nonomuraea sp. RK-328]|nr:CDGSH iron-sulfur domain-containing protein [Nonomuraea sp. RK-328]